ncbi:fasciclin domain-containing protein [Gluconacetobacter tumulisoli]|uniref:FAS1 domain-containing protein n=1 Tax=Gluconacetobacter tumulisoli TaxID=1286189 RepID=A0A7W4K957_9PROT|nr:hypothetical protein [Gluconacetobacter tumulisoli]MBB2202656.1 hypothetical protein [Gluconacetobacter tumulisoli]
MDGWGAGQGKRIGTARGRGTVPGLILVAPLLLGLGGCGGDRVQDPLLVRGSTESVNIPTVSVERTYAPAQANGRPDSIVAYGAPDTPVYRDRPLEENLRGSVELADYVRGLDRSGLLPLLRQTGPFTVFAVPNDPMENFARGLSGGAPVLPPAGPVLRRTLAYTLVRGAYPEPTLRGMIAAAPGRRVGLRTIDGGVLLLWIDPASGQLVLGNGAGQVNRIWVTGVPQSNGVLYLTQSVLSPPTGLASVSSGGCPLGRGWFSGAPAESSRSSWRVQCRPALAAAKFRHARMGRG